MIATLPSVTQEEVRVRYQGLSRDAPVLPMLAAEHNICWPRLAAEGLFNNGDAALDGETWNDCVYLSTTPEPNYQAVKIASVPRSHTVGVNGSYSDSILVDIPQYAPVSYTHLRAHET